MTKQNRLDQSAIDRLPSAAIRLTSSTPNPCFSPQNLSACDKVHQQHQLLLIVLLVDTQKWSHILNFNLPLKPQAIWSPNKQLTSFDFPLSSKIRSDRSSAIDRLDRSAIDRPPSAAIRLTSSTPNPCFFPTKSNSMRQSLPAAPAVAESVAGRHTK